MARRRFTRKAVRRTFAAKRSYRRASGKVNAMKTLLPAFLYGGARAKISEMAAPITNKVPLGTYADEVVFGVAGYLAATKGKGIVKDMGMAVLTIEAASMGNQLMGGMISGSNNSSGGVQFYG